MFLDFLNFIIPSQFPYALQLFAAGWLFSFKTKKRPHFWPRFAAGAAVFLVTGWFVPDVLLAGFFFVPAFVLIPVAVLVLVFMLNTDLKRVAFIVISAFLLQHTTECVTWMRREAFAVDAGSAMWMALSFICYTVSYVGAFFLFVFRKDNPIPGMKSWKMIIMGGITFIIVYIVREVINNLIEINDIDFAVINITINLYSAIASILLFIVLYSVNNTDTLAEDKRILQELLRREQDTYEMVSENINSINYKCHDLKHQIQYLRDPINSEEREKYIQKLERDVMIYERMPKTGNAALDTTLANKCIYCEQKDIEFVFLADAKALDFMEPTEIFSLVGNAIDNAIECVVKYPDKEKRQISMRVSDVGNMLRIYIENYCEEALRIVGSEIVTTKDDKLGHGFGLKSMRYIVDKYHGYMNVDQKDNLFFLTILLPIER